MRRVGLLAICTALLALANAGAVRAGEAAPAPEPGVLPPEWTSCEVAIPKDGLWRPPQGAFVAMDTVRVVARERGQQAFVATQEDPRAWQYRPRKDGAIRFAREDAGRKVMVSYQYQPRRAAVLPTLRATDYDDVVPALEETLAKTLQQRGLVLISTDRAVDAVVEAGIPWPGRLPDDAETKLAAAARKLDVAYLLVAGVSADRESLFAGMETFGNSSSRTNASGVVNTSGNTGTVSGRADTRSTSHSVTVPTYKHYQSVVVCLLVIDGKTGVVVAAPYGQGTKRAAPLLGMGNKSGRLSLVREITAGVVTQWRDGGQR